MYVRHIPSYLIFKYNVPSVLAIKSTYDVHGYSDTNFTEFQDSWLINNRVTIHIILKWDN